MSNPLYTNFKLIHDDLQRMANLHKQINSFGLGDTDQLSFWTQIRDHQENTTFEPPIFPLLYVVPGECKNSLRYKTWDLNLVMLDIVDRDLANQVDVLSDTLQMLQDVLSQYKLSVIPQYGCYDTFYDLLETVSMTPFMEEYTDLNNGWTALIKITTTTPLDRCAAAYNTFTGTPINHDNINFKTFHDDFRLLADHHKQINSFGFGQHQDLSYWTESRLKQENTTFESPFFPLLYVVPSDATQVINEASSYTEYEFNVICMDIIDRDLANQVDVLSDTNQILDDIVAQFRLSVRDSLGCFNAKYYLDEEVTYVPFLEKYSDLCGGWNAILKIKVMTPLDRCAAAFNPFTSPTPSPTPTLTPTTTNTPTPSITPSETPTNTPTITPTNTPTNTNTPSVTPTNTNTPSVTPTCPSNTTFYMIGFLSGSNLEIDLFNNITQTDYNSTCPFVFDLTLVRDDDATTGFTATFTSSTYFQIYDISGFIDPMLNDLKTIIYNSITLDPSCSCVSAVVYNYYRVNRCSDGAFVGSIFTQSGGTYVNSVRKLLQNGDCRTISNTLRNQVGFPNGYEWSYSSPYTDCNDCLGISPTPTNTPTITPTPSSTPAVITHSIWNFANRKWENDTDTWDTT